MGQAAQSARLAGHGLSQVWFLELYTMEAEQKAPHHHQGPQATELLGISA